MANSQLRDALREALASSTVEEIVAEQMAVVSGVEDGEPYVALLAARPDRQVIAVVLTSFADVESYTQALLAAAAEAFQVRAPSKLDS